MQPLTGIDTNTHKPGRRGRRAQTPTPADARTSTYGCALQCARWCEGYTPAQPARPAPPVSYLLLLPPRPIPT